MSTQLCNWLTIKATKYMHVVILLLFLLLVLCKTSIMSSYKYVATCIKMFVIVIIKIEKLVHKVYT